MSESSTQTRALPEQLIALTQLKNWCVWRYEVRKGKPTKPPYQTNNEYARSDDPQTWTTYDLALAAAPNFDGIGFVLTNTEYVAFDIDKCIDPTTGAIHEWAEKLVNRANSYTEVTVSGTGLRIIGLGVGPEVPQRRRKMGVADGVSVELYRKATRFITISGNIFHDAPLTNIDVVIDAVAEELGGERSERTTTEDNSTRTSDLPANLASMLFVQGKGGYPTRSELLFAFLTGCVRAGVSEAAVVAACLDDSHGGCGIYEHCQDNGGHNYIIRQLGQAKETVRVSQVEMATDLGNARRLVRLYGADIRYVHAWRKWLVWRDGHWHKDDDGSVARMAKATIEEMFAEAARLNDESKRTALRSHAIKSQSAQRLMAMVTLAESEAEVVLHVSKLDSDPLLLGVKNGVIDLRTCEFREARRDDYVTKIAGAAFDANAKCPEWMAFLNKVASEGLTRYLQRATGYILTGLTGEEVMFIPWGLGGNGKSTFRETVFAMLGDYAVGADASMLVTTRRSGNATPDLARLYGRRLVTVVETEENALLNEARVKFITSHDIITARNLYEEPFDFTPTHKTVLTTNHKPIVRGTDEGIWRRIHLLPFTRKIGAEEKDVNFRETKLIPELSGVLNWALEGLKAYRRLRGLVPPKEVSGATEEYRSDMDLIGKWIADRCVENEEAEHRTKTLYADYETWAREEVGFHVSKIAFARALVSRGYQSCRIAKKDKDGKVVGYERGIRGLSLPM